MNTLEKFIVVSEHHFGAGLTLLNLASIFSTTFMTAARQLVEWLQDTEREYSVTAWIYAVMVTLIGVLRVSNQD